MDKNFIVSIKRGLLNLENIPRSELISCTETPDGVTFKFKAGTIIMIEDPHMTSAVKQRICLADTSFKKGSLSFNLNDYNNPVTVML